MAGLPAHPTPLRVRFSEFELDEANALLLRQGSAIPLPPTPFGLLCALVRHPGSLLTKHTLLDQAWGHRFVSDSVLKGAISDLRTVLGDDPRSPRFIETVPRRGYRFIGSPTTLKSPPHPETSESEQQQILPAAVVPAVDTRSRDARSFVGRAAELARLRRAWNRATTGTRGIVWIAGEPGIGKTTLVEQFASSLGEVACARGQCVQHYGTGEPYQPVLEILAELCRTDAAVPVLLRSVAPTWLLQLPWIGTAEEREALRQELVGVNPERMLREMGEFLDRYSEQRPFLLITEDLHWGDRATIQLIDYLARRRSSARLMWLSSFRLAEVIASDHALNALRHELRLHGLCEEIVLEPFSEAEVASYVAERIPPMASDESFVRALHERTEGVPLFVASVTGDVTARSAQSGVGAAALLANSPVPENLLAIIAHYLAKLGSEQRLLLSAAAVCGIEFRIDRLSRVLERDALWIADACDQLLREQLWLTATRSGDHEESYSFRHALFRQVLYDRTASPLRAELHRKLGTVLERERAEGLIVSAAELATHFELGRTPLQALRYYAEAAASALLQLCPAETMSLTERALRLLPQARVDDERTSLEIRLATLRGIASFHMLGAGDEAKTAFVRAASMLAQLPLHPMRGLVLHGLGFLLNMRAEYKEALATADRADALASETDDPALRLAACTVQGQVHMLQGRPDAARETLERALPAAAVATAPSAQTFIADPQVTVLATLSLQLAHLGLIRQARERLQEAYARARAISQPMALLVAIWLEALIVVRLGDADRLAALADEMSSLVDKFALAQGKTACRFFRGRADACRGNPLEGFRQIREAYEQNSALGMTAGGSETLGYAAEALVLHGDWRGAQEQLDQALAIANTREERIYLPQLWLIEASIARARDGDVAGGASIRRAIAEAHAQGALWLELLALTELCERKMATEQEQHTLAGLIA